MRRLTRMEMGLAAAGVTILSLWAIWATCGVSIARWFLGDADPAQSAAWGDSFGAFNALISALGFGGVLVTLALQRNAIAQQQSDALSQSEERHRQEFDRTFFQLLGLMREIRSEIFFRYSPAYIAASGRKATKVGHGPEALARAAREVSYWIREREKAGPLTGEELARIYYLKVHSRNETRLGPYYRVIYTILRRVSEDSVLSDSDKCKYGNLLRSQLQSREVLLLALNGLTSMANNFRDYLIEFRIMKYLPSQKMKQTLFAGYPAEAFEARD